MLKKKEENLCKVAYKQKSLFFSFTATIQSSS